MGDDPVVDMVNDPDFAKLNPQQQRQALSAHDPDFANLSDDGLNQFVQSHMNAKPSATNNQGMLAGMTGMPSPSFSPQQKQDFESGKSAGTVSGAATAASGAVEAGAAAALPAVLPHTIAGVKAIGTWAKANPIQAYMLYQVIKEMIPGAKKAIGIVKATPDSP